LQQKEVGVRRRLVQFILECPDRLLYRDEPIWRDGTLVGRITSGMFGHTIGRPVGMGYVTNAEQVITAEWVNRGRYEIEIATERLPARASLKPFYDPSNQRVRM